ncbi:MAG: hypothetical protein J6M30_07565 [Bacteroidales bacterium]|nr:hypothetical protein [Bacteroidales bacterium]
MTGFPFYKVKRKVSIKGKVTEKYVATAYNQKTVDMDMIAEMITQSSTVARSDIYSVLVSMEDCIFTMLSVGHAVDMGVLGTFFPSLQAKACDTPEECNKQSIEKFKLIFKPSKHLKKKFKTIDFQLANSRVIEAGEKIKGKI